MQVNSKMLLIIAGASALVASLVIFRLPSVSAVKVCVVSRDLAPGTPLITAGAAANITPGGSTLGDLLSKRLVPATLISAFDGRRVYNRVSSGTPLSLDHLLAPSRALTTTPPAKAGNRNTQDSYFLLSRQLGTNECAVAIPADEVGTLGNALEPGDVIDLLMPGASFQDNKDLPDSLVSPTAMRNLKVLAVGGRTQDGWVAEPNSDYASGTIILAVPKALSFPTAQIFGKDGAKPRVILHSRNTTN